MEPTVCENVLNIISHHGNTNQNHDEKSLHAHKDGYNKSRWTTASVGDDVEQLESLSIAGGSAKWGSYFPQTQKHSYRETQEFYSELHTQGEKKNIPT